MWCTCLAIPDHGVPQDLADGKPPVRIDHQQFNDDTEYVNWNMIETLNVKVCSQNLLSHAHKRAILEWNMPCHHEEEKHT